MRSKERPFIKFNCRLVLGKG